MDETDPWLASREWFASVELDKLANYAAMARADSPMGGNVRAELERRQMLQQIAATKATIDAADQARRSSFWMMWSVIVAAMSALIAAFAAVSPLIPVQNLWFKIITDFLSLLFGIVVFLAAFELLSRNPKDFGLNGAPVYIIKTIMIALAIFTLCFGISPSLEMDKFIDALKSGKIQHSQAEPVLKTGPSR